MSRNSFIAAYRAATPWQSTRPLFFGDFYPTSTGASVSALHSKVRPIVNYRQTCRWIVCFASSTCVLWPTTIPCGSTPLHSNSYPTHTVLAMQGPQWRSRNVLTAAWSLSTQVRQSAVSQLPPRLSRSERAMAEGPQVQSTPRVQSMLLLTLLGSQQGQENRLRCRQQPRRPNGPTNLAPTTRGGESY